MLHQLPKDITEDLSNNQCYRYRIENLSMGGKIDQNLLSLKPGAVGHSLWIAYATGFMRLYISNFIIPAFIIQCDLISGLSHLFLISPPLL